MNKSISYIGLFFLLTANLGIGLPVLVADYIPKNVKAFLHAENGIVGMVRDIGPVGIQSMSRTLRNSII